MAYAADFSDNIQGNPRCTCANCDWFGYPDKLAAISDVSQRLEPGSETPAGECPSCGALAYIEKAEPSNNPYEIAARALGWRTADLTPGALINDAVTDTKGQARIVNSWEAACEIMFNGPLPRRAETVWVLVVDTKHGTTSESFRTEEGARKSLATYCRQSWNDIVDDRDPAKLSDAEVTASYWDWQSDHGNEWHTLEECIVND